MSCDFGVELRRSVSRFLLAFVLRGLFSFVKNARLRKTYPIWFLTAGTEMKSYWNKKGWEVEQSVRPTAEWVSRVVNQSTSAICGERFRRRQRNLLRLRLPSPRHALTSFASVKAVRDASARLSKASAGKIRSAPAARRWRSHRSLLGPILRAGLRRPHTLRSRLPSDTVLRRTLPSHVLPR